MRWRRTTPLNRRVVAAALVASTLLNRQQEAIEFGFDDMEDLRAARERLKLYQDG